MNQKRVKVTIEIKGDKRKGTCWAKTVTAINKEEKDGFMFVGEFLNDGEVFLEPGTIILQVETHGTWKKRNKQAFVGVVDKEGELIWQPEVNSLDWIKKKVTIVEVCENLFTERTELLNNSETTNMKEYKFRAECFQDVVGLIKSLDFNHNKENTYNTYVISNKDWMMGVEVELTLDLELEELLKIMDQVEDGHRMWQTLTTKEKYNGEIVRWELTNVPIDGEL